MILAVNILDKQDFVSVNRTGFRGFPFLDNYSAIHYHMPVNRVNGINPCLKKSHNIDRA